MRSALLSTPFIHSLCVYASPLHVINSSLLSYAICVCPYSLYTLLFSTSLLSVLSNILGSLPFTIKQFEATAVGNCLCTHRIEFSTPQCSNLEHVGAA